MLLKLPEQKEANEHNHLRKQFFNHAKRDGNWYKSKDDSVVSCHCNNITKGTGAPQWLQE